MAINGVGFGSTSVLNQSVANIQNQLTNLQSQLTTGKISTTYAGLGVNEGLAIAARSQLAEISGFTDTANSVNTDINVANTALQSLTSIGQTVLSGANSSAQTLNSAGQTSAQQVAASQLSSALGILNTQAGDNYVFSGNAINTPPVASIGDILNGTPTQAGLQQVISERQQADLGTNGLGRLLISSPAATPPTPPSVQVAEDTAGSPFGLKLSTISSSLTGASVTGPSGSPAAVSVSLPSNPNNGDQVTFGFNLPDGTTASIQLTASSANPPPAGSFAIGATPAATVANLNAALTSAIGTLANTSLVAASAVAAGNDFFNAVGTVAGSAVKNQAAPPASITGATLLSGAAGTDSLTPSFAAGDSITVNGTPITFVASGATGNQLNVGDSVQTLLSKIDSITGTSTPSTVSNGAITLHNDNGANLTVTSSNPAAFAALGFPATATATTPPLRVNGPPFGSATSLVDGTANTVAWYTGGTTSGSARASLNARIDPSITVQYGLQADEPAIRSQIQALAVFSAVTTSPTSPNGAAQVAALSQRVAQNLSPQPGQQTIEDIQSDFATVQSTISDATARQTQSQSQLQNVIDQTENASPDQVISQILALQTDLQASFQTTSILSQLSLTKFLPPGG
jgi:flagellar hook-associated protein 3 FlgL